MPWKNQGGGPWGSGPKGPWGSGPQPVGPRPPDLEDLLRRAQDRLQQLLPGGYFSGIGIVLILVGVALIWAMSGFYRVQSEELGVVPSSLRDVTTAGDRLQITKPLTDWLGKLGCTMRNQYGPSENHCMMEHVLDADVSSWPSLPPLGRLGRPEDVAGVVSFLVGPAGRWVNGQVVYANGGFV